MLARRARIESRTPLRRKTKLRARKPMGTSSRIKPRVTKRRRPPGYEDPEYLAWLRTQACRVTGCPSFSDAHHARHDSAGCALGAHIKDDTRAMSLCRYHHGLLHSAPWSLKAIVGCELRVWQDQQLAHQRSQYLATR